MIDVTIIMLGLCLLATIARDTILRLDASKKAGLRTVDSQAMYEEIKIANAALLKHEERLSAVEMTVSPSLRRR